MGTTRNSALYLQKYVNKFLTVDARDGSGRLVPIPFLHTVVSGETGGASAGVQDIVNLCVLPAFCVVFGLQFAAENIFASVGVNGTFQIGDATVADRFMVATELYTAGNRGGPISTETTNPNVLAFSGQNFKTTADTIVIGTWKTANPTVGKILKGCFFVVPGA